MSFTQCLAYRTGLQRYRQKDKQHNIHDVPSSCQEMLLPQLMYDLACQLGSKVS